MSEKIDRRTLFAGTVAAGMIAPLGVRGSDREDTPKTDRDRVVALGFTEAEADCWEYAGKAAGIFLRLPELHPMDKQEVASAIHILQNKLLSRPAYRKYLELAKAAETK